MSLSQSLDIALALVLVYALLSLIASGILELLSTALGWRATLMKEALGTLLGKTQTSFYFHPLVSSLAREAARDGFLGRLKPRMAGDTTRLQPSYIPAETFSLALLDIVTKGAGADKVLQDPVKIRDAVAAYTVETELSDALLPLIDTAEPTVAGIRKAIETWFNGVMERTTGWYKRKTFVPMALISLALTIAFNVNTNAIVSTLYNDSKLREKVAAQAELATKSPETAKDKEAGKQIVNAAKSLASLQLPIGWSSANAPHACWDWLASVSGWLFTAMAVSMGAPFWFDLLSKVVELRGALKPVTPEKKPTEKLPAATGTAGTRAF